MGRPARKTSKPVFYTDWLQAQAFAPKKKAKLIHSKVGPTKKGDHTDSKKQPPQNTKAINSHELAGATNYLDATVFTCIASLCPVEVRAVLRGVCSTSREAIDLMLKQSLLLDLDMELQDNTRDDTVTKLTLGSSWSEKNESKRKFVHYACSDWGQDKDNADERTERIIILTQRTMELVYGRMKNGNGYTGWADQEDFLEADNDGAASCIDLSGMDDSTDENRDENKDGDGSCGSDLTFDADESEVESIHSDEHAAYKATFNNIDKQVSDDEEEADLSSDDESEYLEEGALEEDLEDDEYDRPQADLYDDAHFAWRRQLPGNHETYIHDNFRGWGTDVTYIPSITKEEALEKAKNLLRKVDNDENKLELKLLVQYLVKNASTIKYSHYKCHYRHDEQIWQEWAIMFEYEGGHYELHCSQNWSNVDSSN